MKPMHDTNATDSAYGSCVDTWSMWLQRAPVEDRIVVSEIGEQWSPNTAPARTALSIGRISAISDAAAISPAIGSMIPNVPQLVPVAKDIAQDVRKSMIRDTSVVQIHKGEPILMTDKSVEKLGLQSDVHATSNPNILLQLYLTL